MSVVLEVTGEQIYWLDNREFRKTVFSPHSQSGINFEKKNRRLVECVALPSILVPTLHCCRLATRIDGMTTPTLSLRKF